VELTCPVSAIAGSKIVAARRPRSEKTTAIAGMEHLLRLDTGSNMAFL
jgi:hypothetical protein